MYLFSEYEGPQLASLERYIGVFFLAFYLCGFGLIIKVRAFRNYFVLSIVALLVFIYPPVFKNVYPFYLGNPKFSAERDNLTLVAQEMTRKIPETSRVWFIWQKSNGFEAMVVRYEIAPRKMNSWSWSVGDKYNDEDLWTRKISTQDFEKELNDFDYLYFGRVDENFVKNYGMFLDSAPDNGSLYNIIKSSDGIKLVRQR